MIVYRRWTDRRRDVNDQLGRASIQQSTFFLCRWRPQPSVDSQSGVRVYLRARRLVRPSLPGGALLTDQAIRNAKPREKRYKLADGKGLALLIDSNDRKLWRFRYRFNGLEKTPGLGSYPDTAAKLARDKRDGARELLAQSTDPSGHRQGKRVARSNRSESVAREGLAMQKKKLAGATYTKAVWTLETLVFPLIDARPSKEIEAADVLERLRRIEERGLHETAQQVVDDGIQSSQSRRAAVCPHPAHTEWIAGKLLRT